MQPERNVRWNGKASDYWYSPSKELAQKRKTFIELHTGLPRNSAIHVERKEPKFHNCGGGREIHSNEVMKKARSEWNTLKVGQCDIKGKVDIDDI